MRDQVPQDTTSPFPETFNIALKSLNLSSPALNPLSSSLKGNNLCVSFTLIYYSDIQNRTIFPSLFCKFAFENEQQQLLHHSTVCFLYSVPIFWHLLSMLCNHCRFDNIVALSFSLTFFELIELFPHKLQQVLYSRFLPTVFGQCILELFHQRPDIWDLQHLENLTE